MLMAIMAKIFIIKATNKEVHFCSNECQYNIDSFWDFCRNATISAVRFLVYELRETLFSCSLIMCTDIWRRETMSTGLSLNFTFLILYFLL